MRRDLICILCPQGCALTVRIQGDTLAVTGNACPKGPRYAAQECLHPMRTVTAAVRVANRPDTMVSVKTESPIPKKNIMDLMALLRTVTAQAPIAIGDELLSNTFGTRILATKHIP